MFWTLGQQQSLLCIFLPPPLLCSDATSIPPEQRVSPSEQALSGLRCWITATSGVLNWQASHWGLSENIYCAHRQYVPHEVLLWGSWLDSLLQSELGQLLLYWIWDIMPVMSLCPGALSSREHPKTRLGIGFLFRDLDHLYLTYFLWW